MDGSQPLDPRKTIFVGGVPRPLRAGLCVRVCGDRKGSDSINLTSCGCSSGACYDYGPSVWWSVLRWH